MIEQRFGHKELYEVVLRAKQPMQFGDRYVEADEPILYFNDVNISVLNEPNKSIMARGGFGNMPRVVWNDRGEVTFQMIDGVMSSIGMSILFGANVMSKEDGNIMSIHIKEGPLTCSMNNVVQLKYWPIDYPQKKTFIFDYTRNAIQKKIYGKKYISENDQQKLDNNEITIEQIIPRIALYKDKNCQIPAENNREYVVDYYYKYRGEALTYSIKRERFNGFFTLEAKFYSKDENEGINYTNILFMPKVKIVSNINLQLGERADPTVSTFNIIGLPETVGDEKDLIMEIIRLDRDIDAEI